MQVGSFAVLVSTYEGLLKRLYVTKMRITTNRVRMTPMIMAAMIMPALSLSDGLGVARTVVVVASVVGPSRPTNKQTKFVRFSLVWVQAQNERICPHQIRRF